MTDFQKYSASHQTVRAVSNWNNLLDHGLEKTASYIVRKNGLYYEAINGSTGKIGFGGVGNAGGVTGTDYGIVKQAAMNVLTNGGRIFHKRATYTLTSYQTVEGRKVGLAIPDNIEIDAEIGTIITQANGLNLGILITNVNGLAAPNSNIRIKNLKVDGNYAGQTYLDDNNQAANGIAICADDSVFQNLELYNCGLYGGLVSYGSNSHIENINIHDIYKKPSMSTWGLGITSHNAIKNSVGTIFIDSVQGTGLELEDYATENTFNNVYITNCTEGLNIDTSSKKNALNNLYVSNSTHYGIISSGNESLFTNIVSELNGYAGFLGSNVANNKITNGIIKNNGLLGTTAPNGMYFSGGYGNEITSVDCFDDQLTPTQQVGIDVVFGDSFIIKGGYFTNNIWQAVKLEDSINCIVSNIIAIGNIGIQEVNTADYNLFIGNNVIGCVYNPPIIIIGLHSKVKNNIGFVTENSGTSTGTGAQQTIAHGCAFTPSYDEVFLSERSTGGALAYQSAVPDATNIYVLATLNKDYNWKVEKT